MATSSASRSATASMGTTCSRRTRSIRRLRAVEKTNALVCAGISFCAASVRRAYRPPAKDRRCRPDCANCGAGTASARLQRQNFADKPGLHVAQLTGPRPVCAFATSRLFSGVSAIGLQLSVPRGYSFATTPMRRSGRGKGRAKFYCSMGLWRVCKTNAKADHMHEVG